LGTCVLAAPIAVPPDLDDAGLELYRRRVEDALEFVNDDAQRWASGQPRLPRPDAATRSIPPLAA
jgi:hypothetical protein